MRTGKVVTRSQTRSKKRVVSKNDILEGLSLTHDGKYVKLDTELLNRLKPIEVESLKIDPFKEYPIFKNTIESGTSLSLNFLKQCSENMKNDPVAVKMAEMIGNVPLDWLSLKRSKMLENDWNYSVKLPVNPKVTDQGNSGRCWLYAALSSLRSGLMQKYNLERQFEFSETYLYFYDKIERSNMFLEYIWSLRDKNINDREVRMFTNPSDHFLSDGGHYPFFINLVSKYGLVPKNVYDEGINSSNSQNMNEVLITVLNHMALEIFENNWSREQFQNRKEEYMTTIYDLVTRFLGEPLKPTDTFTWSYKDENEDSHFIPNLTPEKFYRIIVPHSNDTKVLIVNDPRHPETYYMSSWIPYSTNMQDGRSTNMINLPIDEFKQIICESLKNEEPVWFSADIGKCFDSETNTSDTKRFDYKSILGIDVEYDKTDMLDMLTSKPTHAMLFIGVDTIEDNGVTKGYKKWRVENSWGMNSVLENEPDCGYNRMTDDYVDKYVFDAVVDLKYFDQDTMEKIMKNENQTYTYDPYDAFGTVAMRSNCKHCSKK